MTAPYETRIEQGRESMSDTIAKKTMEVQVEDQAGGTPLTFRLIEGEPVPDHLVDAYEKAVGSAPKDKAAKASTDK
jgi:hypothetical protein